jgi:hypothetical protein
MEMNSQDVDKLLEQNLSGDLPSPELRARVLRDSPAAFVRARRSGARWRLVALGTAATLIAAVSFLLGRASTLRSATGPAVAGAGDTVAVPRELVAWVNAARLFKQLGMEDRVGRALDRAGRLMPPDKADADSGIRSVFTGGPATDTSQQKPPEGADPPERRESFSVMNRIMAQYSGD